MKTCKHCGQEIKEFQTIICKELKKELRIYKWEDKPFKDFLMPKGFDWAEHNEFVFIYDNSLIELEKYPVVYMTKNVSKKNIKNSWKLAGFYVGSDGLVSDFGSLEDSSGSGRVVISKEIKK